MTESQDKSASKSTKEYRYTGNGVQDFEADGKVVMAGPGDAVNLTTDDLKKYQELVDNGLLLETGGK